LTTPTSGSSPCLYWNGNIAGNGYAYFWLATRKGEKAAKIAYSIFVAPFPDNKVMHHICNNKWCVNPYHIEPVSQSQNRDLAIAHGLRRYARKNSFACGHPFIEDNVYTRPNGYHCCITCQRQRQSKLSERRKVARHYASAKRLAGQLYAIYGELRDSKKLQTVDRDFDDSSLFAEEG